MKNFLEEARTALERAKVTGENPTSQRGLEQLLEQALDLLDAQSASAVSAGMDRDQPSVTRLSEQLAEEQSRSAALTAVIEGALRHHAAQLEERAAETPDWVAAANAALALVPIHRDDAVERLISGMCMTWRHDYGLLEGSERDGLRRSMQQIYQHDIIPFVTRTVGAQLAGSEAKPTKFLRALQAIAEGYVVAGKDDRYIVVANPKHREDDGSDKSLVIDVEDVLSKFLAGRLESSEIAQA